MKPKFVSLIDIRKWPRYCKYLTISLLRIIFRIFDWNRSVFLLFVPILITFLFGFASAMILIGFQSSIDVFIMSVITIPTVIFIVVPLWAAFYLAAALACKALWDFIFLPEFFEKVTIFNYPIHVVNWLVRRYRKFVEPTDNPQDIN